MKKLLLTFLLLTLAAPAWAGDAKESAFDRVMRTGTIKCGYGISPPLLEQDTNRPVAKVALKISVTVAIR